MAKLWEIIYFLSITIYMESYMGEYKRIIVQLQWFESQVYNVLKNNKTACMKQIIMMHICYEILYFVYWWINPPAIFQQTR